jgi:hypothetical protein
MSKIITNNNNILVSKQKPLFERPNDWLTLEDLDGSEEKIVGLYGVFSGDSNYLSFIINGSYTVNWGDGDVENYNSGDFATHKYFFSGISNSTITIDGYKQVIVTITPQSGNNLNIVNFRVAHPIFSGTSYSSTWLELKLYCPNLSPNSFYLADSNNLTHKYLKSIIFEGKDTYVNDMSSFFRLSNNLEYIKFPTIESSSYSSSFDNCYSLKEIDADLKTTTFVSITNVFRNCFSLQKIPDSFLKKGAGIGSANQPFFNCASVTDLDLSKLNLGPSSIISFGLNNMRSIIDPPNISFSGSTKPNFQFFSTGIQYLNDDYEVSSSLISLSNAFNGSHNLMVVPNINVSGITNFTNIFNNTAYGGLLKFSFNNINANINFSNKRLGRNEILEIFNNLKDRTSTTSANINISGCYGAFYLTASDRLIATNKNWTITG